MVVLGVVAGLVILWLALVVVLWVQQKRSGEAVDWRAVMRLAPDVVRLIRRLAADRTVSRATRWWLGGLLVYLLLPIDLIPDFLPVIGYATTRSWSSSPCASRSVTRGCRRSSATGRHTRGAAERAGAGRRRAVRVRPSRER